MALQAGHLLGSWEIFEEGSEIHAMTLPADAADAHLITMFPLFDLIFYVFLCDIFKS